MRQQMTNPGPAFPNTTSVTKFVKFAFLPYHTRKVVDEADWKDRYSLGPASNHFYFSPRPRESLETAQAQ